MNDRVIEIEDFNIGVIACFNKDVSNFKKDRLSLAAATFIHITTAWMNGKAHFTKLALAVQRGYRKAGRREYE